MADDIILGNTVECAEQYAEVVQTLRELLNNGRILAEIKQGQVVGYFALPQDDLDEWLARFKKPHMTVMEMMLTPKVSLKPWHVVSPTEAHPWSMGKSCCGRDGFVFPGNTALEALALADPTKFGGHGEDPSDRMSPSHE
jgi:hypothetical protein